VLVRGGACRYDARAHVNHGVLLMQTGRLVEARSALAQASAIDPLLPEALYNSGCVSARLQVLVPCRTALKAMQNDSCMDNGREPTFCQLLQHVTLSSAMVAVHRPGW
jgi:hypothetical protein